jgi:DNA-binding MurR/RpiR family transcriptional regulator
MTSEFKTMTVKEIAKDLQVSTSFVYRNSSALGAFQACRGGRLLFSEKELKRILRGKSNAISGKKRKVERPQNDRRQETDEIIQKQKRSKKMGGNVQFRENGSNENRHGILD